jgi:hypothetical protein
VIVETKVIGRALERCDREFSVSDANATLRGLITELVRIEIAEYDKRRQERPILRILNAADLADGYGSGRFLSAPRQVPAAPSVDEAVIRALEAFRDGLFLVILDGTQIDDLDAPLTVNADSRLRLLRLVALAGG